jgi:hypothetical protein
VAEPISKHSLNRSRAFAQTLATLMFIIAAAILFMFVRAGGGILRIPALIFANIFLIIGLIQLIRIIGKLRQRPRILVYEQGVRYIDRNTKKVWRWSAFDELRTHGIRRRFGVFTTTDPRDYILHVDGKAALTANPDYQQSQQLAEQFEVRTAETLWPRYVDDFQKGATLTFGKIKINDTTVRAGKTKIEWGTIKDWAVKRGQLLLFDGEKITGKFDLLGVPNAHVMLMAVESIMEGVEHVQWDF